MARWLFGFLEWLFKTATRYFCISMIQNFFPLKFQMEEKVKEIVEIKQRSLAEENQKTLEVLKERYLMLLVLSIL